MAILMAILISTRMTTRTGKRMFQTRTITEGMNMKTKRKTIPTKKELLRCQKFRLK